jgi:formylglycine-generating enzyme required for sulfatase activity
MGCDSAQECNDNEKPVHRVTIRPFRLGRYEVTQAQWTAVMGGNPAQFKGDERPVDDVSWDDVQEFLKRISANRSGKTYRLPTEAEWEYAARGGAQTAYWWGQDIGKDNANCNGCGSYWDNDSTAPVGACKANSFGLYDMAGNVWEWVQDCYHSSYAGAPGDGSAWCELGPQPTRVARGGSWSNSRLRLRAAGRDGNPQSYRSGSLGFRLAQDR